MSIFYAYPMNEICVKCGVLCIPYEWNAKKSMIMKRDNLICASHEWGFIYSLNGMLNSYVYEKERPLCLGNEWKFMCLALDAYLCV